MMKNLIYIQFIFILLFVFNAVKVEAATFTADRSEEPGFECANGICTYSPPIGVPMPEFGIMEYYTMYNDENKRNLELTYSPDGYGGYYTHYVDNSNVTVTCTNTNNVFGTQTTPRCSLPGNIPAGSVVAIAGGPYNSPTDVYVTAAGTEEQPIFIRGMKEGGHKPVFSTTDDSYIFNGQYAIIENLVFIGTKFFLGDNLLHTNLATRNIEVKNHMRSNAMHVGASNSVIYNSHAHHNQGNDRHGVYVAGLRHDVWILDSTFNHNGGDGIQFCHGCGANGPTRVYIGRNEFFGNRENAVDFKYSQDLVVSENTMYNHIRAPSDVNWCFDDGSRCGVFSSGSDGAAVVIGSDGAPSNVWIIYNKIYNNAKGIRVEEGVGGVYIVGNLIYNNAQVGIHLQKKRKSVVHSSQHYSQ